MSEELSHILAECIEAIEQNRLTLDECLDAHPHHRVELEELLSVVMQAKAVPTAYAPTEFRQKARGQLLAKLPPRSTASNGRVADRHLLGTRAIVLAISQRTLIARQKLAGWWPLPLRPSLVAGAILLFVVILFAALWLRGQGSSSLESQLVREGSAAPGVQTEAAGQDTVSKASRVFEESSGESAGAVPADEKFSALLPVVAHPLNFDAQTAIVAVSQGIVEVQDASGEWLIVDEATSVNAGQRIRTGAYSGATVTFYDGSQALLQSNTELSLDQLDAQRPEDGLREVVMTQWVGESEHRVDFRNDSGSRYEVRTPNGSGRARGTVFQVIVTLEQVTQYIVTEGRVDVTHLDVTVIVTAGQVSLVSPEEPPSQPYFTVFGQGEVTAMGETWTIGGQTFATTASTTIVGDPQIGDIVSVYGYMLPDGALVATHIILRHHTPANSFTLTGIVEQIGEDEWIVAGRAIAVNEETRVDDTVVVGDLVRVYGVILAEDGEFLAQRIDRVDEAFDFEFVGVVQSITADTWNISGLDIALDEGTEIESGITVGDVVEVEGEILADGTWLAHEIHLYDEDREAEFEFSGRVENVDPWVVAGIPFETDAYTKIDDDIDVGDLVHVEGQILADGTWLATEIRLASDDDMTFTLIGLVDSIDPWVVGGVPVTVDGDTLIDDDIVVGDLVRVEGLVLADGTLLAVLIERLDEDQAGCYTLTTTVISVDGSQVMLKGLPVITLHDDVLVDGEITPNAIVTVSVCFAEDGSVIIISIVIVISIPPPPPPPPSPGPGGNGGYVVICHKPGTPAEQTKSLPLPALNGHLGHGDTLGPCR